MGILTKGLGLSLGALHYSNTSLGCLSVLVTLNPFSGTCLECVYLCLQADESQKAEPKEKV